jgi:hypothetical protein
MTVPEEKKKKRSDYLNTYKKNESYDLWALYLIKSDYISKLTPELKVIMKKVSYIGSEKESQAPDLTYKDILLLYKKSKKPSFFKNIFTRKEKVKKTNTTRKSAKASSKKLEPKKLPDLIRTVQDAANYFLHSVVNPDMMRENLRTHEDEEILGDLHVYLDGTPMYFEMSGDSEA